MNSIIFFASPLYRQNSFSYAVSLLRPFALRLLTILLPCFVDILFKKPCVLARFILLGWNVLFIGLTSLILLNNYKTSCCFWKSILFTCLNPIDDNNHNTTHLSRFIDSFNLTTLIGECSNGDKYPVLKTLWIPWFRI